MQVLTYFILATYVAQIIQICFFAVPSAGSTVEMLFKVKKNPAHAAHHPSAAAIQSRTKMAMLIGFIFFLINASYRIKMEEVYLKRTFGDDYTQYMQQVGKYFPRLRKYRHEHN